MFFSHVTIGQEHIYQNFGVDDGLPSSEVYDIYQDKEGYIWFATDKGLSRYNGYEFENFDTSDGLTGNVVLRFYPQENGQIWCYSFHTKSLFYFDEIFRGFKLYKYNHIIESALAKRSTIKSIFLDKSNNLHIGGIGINGEIIVKNDGTVVNNFRSENSLLDSIGISKMVLMNYENSLTSPFYFTTKDTSKYDPNFLYINHSSASMIVSRFADYGTAVFMTDSIVEINVQNQEIIPIHNKHSPIGLKVIDSIHFFVGYLFGGGKIIDKGGTIKDEFLKDKSISNFLIDHEGGYWFTTIASGLYYIKNPSTRIYNSINTKSNEINSLAKNSNQELLIGYKNGITAKVSNYGALLDINLPAISMHAFVEFDSSTDQTYFYSNSRLRNSSLDSIIISDYLLKLSEPKDNTIFGATIGVFYSGGENQETKTFPSPYRVHDVCVWGRDTIIATPNGVFNYKNGSYLPLSDQSKLYNYRCEDIDVNSKNIMFAATHGTGVIVHTGSHILTISEIDGLNSNVVNEIHIENDSTI